jgi:glycosyltransferase involved in cell wall biosynthesis
LKSKSLNINVVVSFLAPREAYRPIIISPREVFCSPHCETKIAEGNYQNIQTHSGVYDINTIIEKLPQSQKPDLIVVKADATGGNFPINLKSISCPKLLICGNTQHLSKPIQTLVEYATEEQFDFIMSDHKRHHLHYFKEAGFEKVFWVPGFNINPHPQPTNLTPKYPLTFVGQARNFHPYRKSVLAHIKESQFPLHQLQAPQEKAAEIYAESLINLNVSMNGDLNLRVFEVLSSGGFLLTDKLSKQAGFELLFEDNKHLALFRNKSELNQKLAFFLNNPQAAKEIASKGCEIFWQNHRPEMNIKRVLDYIDGKDIEPIYKIEAEKRSIYISSNNLDELRQRIYVYEYLQEIHLKESNIKGLFLPKVDSKLICDLVDLPRLEVNIISDRYPDSYLQNDLFYQCEISDQIRFITEAELAQKTEIWDFIILTTEELQTIGIEKLLSLVNFQWLIIADNYENNLEKFDVIIERCGFKKESDRPLVYHWQRKADWGTFLLSQQKNVAAIEAFQRALKDNAFDTIALLELGLLYVKLDDLIEAEKLLSKAVSLERRNPVAMEHFAKVSIALKKYEEAANILEHLVQIKAEEVVLWSLLEKCYLQTGSDEKALEIYRYYSSLKEGKTRQIFAESKAQTNFKRILVINNLYPPQELGGYGRSIGDFANILQQRGHTIQVLTSDAPYLGQITTPEPNINRKLELFGTFEGQTKAIENARERNRIVANNDTVLREAIADFLPDVCLVGNMNFLGPAIFKPFLDNYIPVINHLGFGTLLCSAREMPQKTFFTLATASEYVRQQIVSQGYPIDDTIVVYPGAMVKQFQMCVLPNIEKLRIVYAGLIVSFKGPHVLIEALKILDDLNVDFECSLAGDSLDQEYPNALKEYVVKQGMGEKVKFLGFLPREKLIHLFSKKNVLVFPSVWEEPFGISQVEGMAAGLTLITSATGGASEIAESDISGLTIPPNNARALAESLISLTRDKERWQRIAAAGQERAITVFDINRSVDRLGEEFDNLLQKRDRHEGYLQEKIIPELRTRLRLREINLIVFPDWAQPEELLWPELERVLRAILTHPDSDRITLLIDSRGISEEEANLALSGVVMNLLMEEDLGAREEPEISLVGEMEEIEWRVLLSAIDARIALASENLPAIAEAKAETVAYFDLDSFSSKRAVQLENGVWELG